MKVNCIGRRSNAAVVGAWCGMVSAAREKEEELVRTLRVALLREWSIV
jgi:hypothetical protein